MRWHAALRIAARSRWRWRRPDWRISPPAVRASRPSRGRRPPLPLGTWRRPGGAWTHLSRATPRPGSALAARQARVSRTPPGTGLSRGVVDPTPGRTATARGEGPVPVGLSSRRSRLRLRSLAFASFHSRAGLGTDRA